MTGAEDLTAWLRSALDRVERQARAAMNSPESLWASDGEGGLLHTNTGGNGFFATGPWGGGIRDEEIEHIVFWQPRRVLRLVEAKRRILDVHEPYDSESHGAPACWTCG